MRWGRGEEVGENEKAILELRPKAQDSCVASESERLLEHSKGCMISQGEEKLGVSLGNPRSLDFPYHNREGARYRASGPGEIAVITPAAWLCAHCVGHFVRDGEDDGNRGRRISIDGLCPRT